VERAREHVRALPAVRVDEGDAYALPYQSGSYDVGQYERVLMHLADPVAAIREMRRVVRTGGQIVAVEPAWDTMTIDHPDYEAIDLMIRRANAVIRHSRMGIELNRLMAETDPVERSVQVVPPAAETTQSSPQLDWTYPRPPRHSRLTVGWHQCGPSASWTS
jgi:SAM-dependent methyltransferase